MWVVCGCLRKAESPWGLCTNAFLGTEGLAMSQSNTKLCQRVGGCGRVGAREEWRVCGVYAAAASLQGRRGLQSKGGWGQGWALITSAQRRHIHTYIHCNRGVCVETGQYEGRSKRRHRVVLWRAGTKRSGARLPRVCSCASGGGAVVYLMEKGKGRPFPCFM